MTISDSYEEWLNEGLPITERYGKFAMLWWHISWPVITSACADCGVGTWSLKEWYTVHDEVWDAAWPGPLKPWQQLPGQQVLCIGCLEKRLGRTLCKADFPEAHSLESISPRLHDRLTRTPT